MPSSYAEPRTLTCPHCSETFPAEIPLIIDAGERPDLLEKVKDGTIHQFSCPDCEEDVLADALLLIYFPPGSPAVPQSGEDGKEVRLLMSPAELTPEEEFLEQAFELLMPLMESVGDAWQDEWLDNCPIITRPLLPTALIEGLGAVQRKLQEQSSPQNLHDGSAGPIPEELRSLLQEIGGLRRLSEMPRKIELCQRALSMVRREENPLVWGVLQVELANALAQNPQGSRSENLERAIDHYEQALEVFTRAAYPDKWAMMQNNLANAYADRIRGERAENLERAIHHYEQALEVYTREAYPEQWATTQNNLANAYADRIRGERAENLERAIHH